MSRYTMIKAILPTALMLAARWAAAAPVQYDAAHAGTIFTGPTADVDWGRPVVSGDLNGDGYDEIIVSASDSWGGQISRVYVLRGGPNAHGRGFVDLGSTPADQVIIGATADDNLGSSLGTGDVTGDGVADLLICASTADYGDRQDAGIAYLVFGGPDFFASPTRDLNAAGAWDLRLIGPVAGGDMGGANLFGGLDAHSAAIGRVNDDIYGDIVLGVHLADGAATQSGRVYVVFGGPFPSGFTLNLSSPGSYNVRIDGAGTYDELGTIVLTGDLTGDGIEELILPNQYRSQGLFTSEGAVHIYRGRSTWLSSYSLATAAADITLLGNREDDELGTAAVVGDFNSDGLADLATAAPGADAGAFDDQLGDGFVYGLLGNASLQTGTHTIDYATATPDFLLIGEYQEHLGAELSAGDFDGDGFDDLAAAERFAGPQTNGAVVVLFGRSFTGSPSFTANVDTDLHILGAAQDRIGFSLSAADVNNDGLHEVVFGTPFNAADHGSVYILTHVTGDHDHDGDADLSDFCRFQACFTGQDPPTGEIDPGCFVFDFDLDSDIDLADHGEFLATFTGPVP